jgi:hypothetical protein
MCHLPGTFDLPAVAGAAPSREEELTCTEDPATDVDAYCDVRVAVPRAIPPETAACTSCHDAASTRSHAEVMTTSLGGESCATCHASGSAFGIDAVHAMAP